MSGFLKTREVFEETYRVDDLLDFSSEINRLDSVIQQAPYSALVGYVGRFGSGKSTAIYQLRKQYEQAKKSKWFEFDAWKYPERRDLWEGFVLDIADQMGSRKRVKKQIDGDTKTSKTVGAISEIAQGLAAFTGLSYLVSKFAHLFDKQPIERVFELQEILVAMFGAVKEKDIFIVVEDIDRSGDAGQYFLETLRQFIKNNLAEKRIVILVPIGSEIYDKEDDLHDSLQKVLDYQVHFEPRSVKYSKFLDYFDESTFPATHTVQANVQDKSLWREHIEDWFALAARNGLNIRKIKSAVREANAAFIDLRAKEFKPDPRIVLAITLLNYVYTEGKKRWVTRLETKHDITSNCPIYNYLQVVARNQRLSEYPGHWRPGATHFVEDRELILPAYVTDSRAPNGEPTGRFWLSDFYLIPFGRNTQG